MLAHAAGPYPFSALRLAALAGCLAFPTSVVAHGDLHERIDALTQSIQANPTNAQFFLDRGELRRLHAEPELAIGDFERALGLNPSLDAAQLGMGEAWLDVHQPGKARPWLDVFLAKHPQHAEALLARARVLAALGERRAAAADYTGALAGVNNPLPEIYLARADVLVQEGLVDEAVAGLDEGTARLGRAAPLELRAVDLELGRKRYVAALIRLDRQIERVPRKEFLLSRRGAILEQAGRMEEARAAYFAADRALQTLPPERRATRAVSELAQRIQASLARLTSP